MKSTRGQQSVSTSDVRRQEIESRHVHDSGIVPNQLPNGFILSGAQLAVVCRWSYVAVDEEHVSYVFDCKALCVKTDQNYLVKATWEIIIRSLWLVALKLATFLYSQMAHLTLDLKISCILCLWGTSVRTWVRSSRMCWILQDSTG